MSSTAPLGRVVQVNVNPRGGVPKHAVPAAEVTTEGVVGDKQRDRRFHGGPTRAVCLFALERIEALRAEGHPISPGSTGENLTVSGIDWDAAKVGDRLRLGDWVELEITGYAAPCSNIAESFADGEFKRMSQKLHPGWSRLYAQVITPGEVRLGDAVEIIDRGSV
jgi:MOSC domain-containing protein YiiM